MKYRFITENNKVTSIVEHTPASVTATALEVYTGSVEWVIKNLPLLGIDISLIYSDGLAEKTAENALKVVDISDHPTLAGVQRKFHVLNLPINSDERFFVVRGVVRHYDDGVVSTNNPDVKVDLPGDNNTRILLADGSDIGEYDYYQQEIEAGVPLLDLVTGGIAQRDSEGRFENIY
jgi:hypothetical protein